MKAAELLPALCLVISLGLLAGCGKPGPRETPTVTEAELTNAPPAATEVDAGMVRFDARPGSKMRIEGTSNIHDWQVQGLLIGGFLEAGANFPLDPGQACTPGKVAAKAEAFIPVRSLKSVDKEGKPYSDKMDDIMCEKLKSPPHARITYRLTELALTKPAAGGGEPYACEAKGELAVAGVTNLITMPVNVLPLGDNKLKVSGAVGLKMTSFNVEPPAPLGLFIKTGDEVKLIFEWNLARKPVEAATPK
jgi:hypothetical protein